MEVMLDAVTHRYIEVETGRVVRGVSGVIRRAGLRPAPPVDASWSGVVAAGMQRGTEVHRLTRALDESSDVADAFEDRFDSADLTESNVNYVAAYHRFLRESGFKPTAWEAIVWHPELDYAGRLDVVGWLNDATGLPRRILIDKKTGSVHKSVWVQLSAYRLAWDRLHPTEFIDEEFALLLLPDQTYRLLPNPLGPRGADPFWLSALWMDRWHAMSL
jgi:hypothetical protein